MSSADLVRQSTRQRDKKEKAPSIGHALEGGERAECPVKRYLGFHLHFPSFSEAKKKRNKKVSIPALCNIPHPPYGENLPVEPAGQGF